MKELTPKSDRSTALAVDAPVNLDGKGNNGFLLDWYRTEPRGVVAKPQRQVLAEFFTSMLILSAQFKYKPAVGVDNYLYCLDNTWRLSLIGPEQWSDAHRAGFAGTCVLQSDMTWTINPSDNLQTEGALTDAIGRFFDAFRDTLDTDLTLEDILPFYVQKMPYWQRLHASALSRSIRHSTDLSGDRTIPARSWLPALPRSSTAMLSRLPAERGS